MYVNFNENPRGNYYAGDCVIRAISAVMNEPWEKIYTELCAEGYDMGDWGNSNAVWDAYLRRRGFKRYVCSNDCPSCYSLANLQKITQAVDMSWGLEAMQLLLLTVITGTLSIVAR